MAFLAARGDLITYVIDAWPMATRDMSYLRRYGACLPPAAKEARHYAASSSSSRLS